MPRAPRRLRAALRVLFYVVIDWLYVAAWQVYGLFTSSDTRQYLNPPNPRETAVVIIPGVYEPWRFMKPLSDTLHREGYPVHVIAGLGYNTGNIPAMASIVHRYLVESDTTRAVVVAHSKGGLIGKYVLANLNEDGRLKHVVAINTPFAGSIYANFAPVRTVRIFSTRDAVIARLQANLMVNTTITSVYSKYDPNIPHSSFLEGATNVTIDIIGHFHVVSNKEVHRRLLEILERIEVGANP